MTDGTSQGLFIVVAIVIFGIFVVMAYILFEDTLSPALASMFKDSTEQANDRLSDKHKPFDIGKLSIYNPRSGMFIIHSHTPEEIVFETEAGNSFAGVNIPKEYLMAKGSYVLTYDVTLLEGAIVGIGGHLLPQNEQEFFVNNEKINKMYYNGTPYNMGMNETIHVKVYFSHDGSLPNNILYIQPNRGANPEYSHDYKIRLSNMRFSKVR